MAMLGSLAFSVAHRLRGSQSLALLREMRDEPWQPREIVLARQLERLRALLAHAERHVPYYRETFRAAGVRSADVRSLDDFARLPVLTKDVLRTRREDLIAETVDRATLFPQHSGGSTGVPVSFFRDRAYLDASDAGTYRNLEQCGWRPGDMVAFVWGFNDRLDRMRPIEFRARQHLRRFYQFDPFKSGPAELSAWAREWRRLRPAVALGYASTIARFAEHLLATGTPAPRLKGVFTTAEKLYPPQRAAITRAFGCDVFDLYGSSEVQNIAAECPVGGMHVNADFCVLETEGEADGTGTPRAFLVTSLKQWTMPFIRYRNEDCGTLLDGTCECGRGFPLLRLDVARLSDNFLLPGDRVVHGEFFTHLMYGSEGIASFQFHQTAIDRIVIRVVPGPGSTEARATAVRRAVEQVEALSPGALAVEVEEVASIPLSSAGKHRFTRSDVRPEAVPSEVR